MANRMIDDIIMSSAWNLFMVEPQKHQGRKKAQQQELGPLANTFESSLVHLPVPMGAPASLFLLPIVLSTAVVFCAGLELFLGILLFLISSSPHPDDGFAGGLEGAGAAVDFTSVPLIAASAAFSASISSLAPIMFQLIACM
eukprot:CAMPEP_0197851358 /NCGR_PEP_ID=MMETSP1438-20131217/17874_1 /TAXON_ID=1461541 /ORGANISM="Pterosperma sp., Strain CCMP1384" /LENGTH=141 /DNA_ID=CAMNT_0043464933 /DNA_START=827 /DNA_END=1252 /DNA_ORIENTATION=-